MQRTSVKSSVIKSVGYEAETKILEVEFVSGGIYQYHGVSGTTYSGLMTAASHGQYWNAHVKNAGYSFTKIV